MLFSRFCDPEIYKSYNSPNLLNPVNLYKFTSPRTKDNEHLVFYEEKEEIMFNGVPFCLSYLTSADHKILVKTRWSKEELEGWLKIFPW